MNKLILFIFSKTSLGKLIDGKKTVIGALFIIVAAALQALEQISPLFPQYAWLKDASEALAHAIRTAEPALEALGLGFLTAGVIHKNAKAKLPPVE